MTTLFISSFISLFSLINPLSAMPVFISLTNGFPKDHLYRTVRRTSIYVLLVCVISFLIGEFILDFFGVSIHALKIAGGIIISRSGFQLLNSQHKSDIQGEIEKETRLKEDISFSPLALPLLAGPGSMSLLINLGIQSKGFNEKATIIAAITGVAIVIYLILSSAPFILKYLGQTGLRTLSKIMGLLVLSIGIQMIVASGRMLFETGI
ncbi:MAG: NAAT family transporter [Flavobacteriia bacterium]|jgi:multiple antibiotic resistance protein|nr:NAAT family transporter [Flavobacteriia bacterium]